MELTKDQKLYATIVQKAWEDKAFKDELMANPVAAIEKLSGETFNLPNGKTLVVKDQTDSSKVYINIPPRPKTDDMELSETQLDAVSGGTGILETIGDILSYLATPRILR